MYNQGGMPLSDLTHTISALFEAVREQYAAKSIGRVGNPLVINDSAAELIEDPRTWPAQEQIARGGRLPWKITNLESALKRATIPKTAGSGISIKVATADAGPFIGARMLMQHVLMAARAAANHAPYVAALRFGLSESEIIALRTAPGVSVVPASAWTQLTFVPSVSTVLRAQMNASSRGNVPEPDKDVLRLACRITAYGGLRHG